MDERDTVFPGPPFVLSHVRTRSKDLDHVRTQSNDWLIDFNDNAFAASSKNKKDQRLQQNGSQHHKGPQQQNQKPHQSPKQQKSPRQRKGHQNQNSPKQRKGPQKSPKQQKGPQKQNSPKQRIVAQKQNNFKQLKDAKQMNIQKLKGAKKQNTPKQRQMSKQLKGAKDNAEMMKNTAKVKGAAALVGSQKLWQKIWKLPCMDFFIAEPDKYKTWKMFLGFPFGGLLGLALYGLVVSPMALPEETRKFLGALLTFGLAAGYSLSVATRCVCFLLIPTFMGKAGRSYIGTFAIAFLISGPIENIVDNAQDITRSMTCAAELAANQTAAKWKFRVAPVGNVLKDMQEEGFMLKRIGEKMDRAFLPVRTEIRGDEEVKEMEERTRQEDELEGGELDRAGEIEKETAPEPNDEEGTRVEKKYREKVKFECEDVFNKGVVMCRKVFTSMVNRCRDKLPAVIDDILCPLLNMGFLCKLIEPLGKLLGGECKTDEIIKPSFGKMFTSSEKTIDNMDQNLEVDMKYKVVQTKEELDYTSVEEMKSNTVHDFQEGRTTVEFIFVLIKRVLGFTFLLVVFSAYKYYKKYCQDIRYDNIYITPYFKKIDARRKHKKKRVLLPLKKMEKTCYISTTSPKLLAAERLKLVKGSILTLTRAVLAGLVFFVAHLLYTVLDIIRTYSRVDYKQVGTNHIDIQVEGVGFMSQIVRLFMKGLNAKNKLHQISSNLECLPQPVAVDRKYYLYVFGIFSIVWILILVDAYALRLRRMIAGFFFRKREKHRVLHLYNLMQKKRKFFLKDMKRKVKRKAKMETLRSKSGLFQSIAKIFKGKDKCLICEEVRQKTGFVRCGSKKCEFVYCQECWHDIKKKCYACMPKEEFSSTDSDVSINLSSGDDE